MKNEKLPLRTNAQNINARYIDGYPDNVLDSVIY